MTSLHSSDGLAAMLAEKPWRHGFGVLYDFARWHALSIHLLLAGIASGAPRTLTASIVLVTVVIEYLRKKNLEYSEDKNIQNYITKITDTYVRNKFTTPAITGVLLGLGLATILYIINSENKMVVVIYKSDVMLLTTLFIYLFLSSFPLESELLGIRNAIADEVEYQAKEVTEEGPYPFWFYNSYFRFFYMTGSLLTLMATSFIYNQSAISNNEDYVLFAGVYLSSVIFVIFLSHVGINNKTRALIKFTSTQAME